MATIKLKALEEFLQGVDGFKKPKVLLEQYSTPSHIASCMLHSIQTKYADIKDKLIADLGCGCGMLSIGAFLLGAQFTVGFEIDVDAVRVFRDNVTEMQLPAMECVQCDVLTDLPTSRWINTFDTVLINPPFGTKHNAGVDIRFLQVAFNLATTTVYSLHKSSTREFLKKKSVEWSIQSEVIAELRYNLDNSYKFHRKTSVDIEVDCWRFDLTTRNKDEGLDQSS